MVPLSKKHSITTVDKSASRGNLFFQPKLTINAPDDIYEKEADAVADRVVQSKTAGVSHFFKPVNISMLQRKCAHCEEEEKRKAQRKEQNGNTVDAPESVEQYLGGLNNSGSSLSTSTQDFFQSQMGYNFSDVKIHTGSIAAKSAQSINALAYTSGNNIVFNEGQYQPNTNTGKRLLAHELTHVVQQGNGVASKRIQTWSWGRAGVGALVGGVGGAVVGGLVGGVPGAVIGGIGGALAGGLIGGLTGSQNNCSGGWKTLLVSVFFRRRATSETMRVLREKINEAKRILRLCCINLFFDFNWGLLRGATDFDPGTARPSGDANGAWDYANDSETLGEGNTFSGARGIPMLVVDNVPRTGGGVTISNDFDNEYTGRSYIVIPIDSGRTRSIAHELGHVAGILSHTDTGVMDSSGATDVDNEYCDKMRSLAH